MLWCGKFHLNIFFCWIVYYIKYKSLNAGISIWRLFENIQFKNCSSFNIFFSFSPKDQVVCEAKRQLFKSQIKMHEIFSSVGTSRTRAVQLLHWILNLHINLFCTKVSCFHVSWKDLIKASTKNPCKRIQYYIFPNIIWKIKMDWSCFVPFPIKYLM